MWTPFILQNVHFAICLLAAQVFFGAAWLHLDAWMGKKPLKDGLKVVGFLVLSVSFLLLAGSSDTGIVSLVQVIGYSLLVAGMAIDPLPAKPKQAAAGLLPPLVLNGTLFAVPVLAFVTSFLFLRRALRGLETQLAGLGWAFAFLGLSSIFGLRVLWQNSTAINLYRLTQPFGPLWVGEHLALLAGVILAVRWLFYYLLKRLSFQLFMVLSGVVLVIFLVTTTAFTFLLIQNFQTETLKRFESDARILGYLIQGKEQETLANTQVLAQNPQVVAALVKNDNATLYSLAQSTLLAKGQTSLIIASASGLVVARGEEEYRIGDSVSGDPLFVRTAQSGGPVVTIVARAGALSPQIVIQAASPIVGGGKTMGMVKGETVIDNSYLDGVKSAAGLDAAVFGGDTLAATTIVGPDGKTRPVGIKESQKAITESVLGKGKPYIGMVELLNTNYFATFVPLTDVDNVAIGMLFTGQPATAVFVSATEAMGLTFWITIVLLVVSLGPSYLVARFITKQME